MQIRANLSYRKMQTGLVANFEGGFDKAARNERERNTKATNPVIWSIVSSYGEL